jgi:hypothetical protein
MHRFRSKSIINRFRLVSMLVCLKFLLLPAAIALIITSVARSDIRLVILALWLGGAAFLLIIVQWITAARTRCPLCMTPVLAKKGCSKHRHSRKLFGSYRLRVATSVLTKGRFTCPYCNEPSSMEVRHRTL